MTYFKTKLTAALLVIVAGAFLGLGCSSDDSGTNSPPPSNVGNPADSNVITIDNFAFTPAALTVKVGTTVTWRNAHDESHTVTSDTGSELDSPLLATGGVYTHTFNAVGTYPYHCTPHPFMRGTVVVEQ